MADIDRCRTGAAFKCCSPMPLRAPLILHPGERLIASEQMRWSSGPWHSPHQMGPQGPTGMLYVTNSRIIFEAVQYEGPGIGYAPRTVMDLGLNQVTNVRAFPGAKGEGLLRVEAGPNYICTFGTQNALNWARAISETRSTLVSTPPPPPPPTGGAPTTPLVVQVQQQPAQPSVFLHCRHCGSLSPAGSSRCASCGAGL
jgi:hypothetical protein